MPLETEVRAGRPKNEHVYPCLLRHRMTGMVVLFSEERRGTVVHNPTDLHFMGEHSTLWDMGFFSPTDEDIVLRNKM